MILASEMEIQDSFTLFPNPANTLVTVRFKQPISGKLSLIKINGLVYFEEELKKVVEKTISISNSPKGIYLVVLKNENNILTKKLVIE